MARAIQFDLPQYDANGVIPLFQGDDWSLSGKVLLFRGDQVDDQDLSDVSAASAWFPGSSGPVLGIFSWADQKSGRFTASLPASGTAGTQLSANGLGMYLTMQEPGALTTVPTVDSPLGIQVRGFSTL